MVNPISLKTFVISIAYKKISLERRLCMRKRICCILIVCLIITPILNGCSGQSNVPANQESGQTSNSSDEIRVGVVLPLSGPNAHEGELCRNAMEFATEKINNEGGIKALEGKKLKLVFGDHTGNAQVAINETERILLNEKVIALLGPYTLFT
jgi:branched-chain amino acid transport system substrate-binding protein